MKLQNTDSIFNVIGDYPVVDQFDILYSNLQAGSTYDNYVTGSLFTRTQIFGQTFLITTPLTASRGRTFSKLTVSQTARPEAANDQPNQSYGLQPWRERAGILRNVRMFSSEERYYDSLLPNLSTMVKVPKISGSLVLYTFSATQKQVYLALGTLGGGFQPGATGFIESFPFEPVFSNIPRLKDFSDGFIATVDDSFETLRTPFATRKIVIRDLTRFYDSTYSVTDGLYWTGHYQVANAGRANPGVMKEDAAKILFGFGDNRTQGPDYYSSIQQTPKLNTPMYRLQVFTAASYNIAVSPVIRGWKYGLISGVPHYSSAVFRRDRFGQFRDMLEQRQDSSMISDPQNSPAVNFGSFETQPIPTPKVDSGAKLIGSTQASKNKDLIKTRTFNEDPPVKVKFLRKEVGTTDGKLFFNNILPTETWSSNVSLYATSSLPYFDGVSRNRTGTTIPPNSYLVTSFTDAAGNATLNIG